jgi:hypothetical protein
MGADPGLVLRDVQVSPRSRLSGLGFPSNKLLLDQQASERGEETSSSSKYSGVPCTLSIPERTTTCVSIAVMSVVKIPDVKDN